MGALLEQKPVKLIISIIYKDESFLVVAENLLIKRYGEKEQIEAVFPFEYTNYYEKEFGADLKRKIFCFRKLIAPESAGKIKLFTNRVEDKLKAKNNRTVNIDPGYLTEAKLVLFTTKDYSHRIYLTFKPWPWSYPDYASNEMVDYFNKIRSIYAGDVKS